jgi:REP element-mobilizing transposase RayT
MFYRRTLPHLQRDDKPHFITFCTRDRWILPEPARDIVLDSSLHDDGLRYDLRALVIMPDHVHLIVTPLVNITEQRVWLLPEILDAIKGASAHRINRQLGRKGSVWQEESFDHVLRGSERLRDKVQYVLENPVRKGLVGQWEKYRWLWVRPFENPFQPGQEPAGLARLDGRGRPSPRNLM